MQSLTRGLLGTASWEWGPGLHMPHCDFFKCMDKDLKLCSLQSYSGHLLNENGIFLGLYPARI